MSMHSLGPGLLARPLTGIQAINGATHACGVGKQCNKPHERAWCPVAFDSLALLRQVGRPETLTGLNYTELYRTFAILESSRTLALLLVNAVMQRLNKMGGT
ncbi:hypothetical protein [Massilia sp. TS11]|uniref:hypothetical protein n=1 Tax=Massilia sp. TS11 TaxID=2908003 RepID=UPI001EDAD801|nr:hypothetical protein [Massilia sp. TS11]MCG2583520.1 hypothetical protein [Massilia sp. TS11]